MSFIQMEVPGLTGYAVYPEEFLSRIILEDSPGVILWCAVPYSIAAGTALLVFTLAWPRHTDMSWRSLSPDLPDKLSEPFRHEKIIGLLAVSVMALPLFLIIKTSGISGFPDFWSANAQAVQTSLSYGLLSVMIAMITACLLTDWLMELSPAWRNIFMGIFMLQLLIPGALTGLGMKSLARFPLMLWLDTGDILMIISHSLRIIPYAVFLLYALRRMNESLVQDNIRLMNISWFGKKRFLHFPADRAGLLVISGILFVLLLSELSSTILVVSPGTETVILRLYNMLHYGANNTVAKLALLQSALVTAIMLILWLFIRRRADRD
jgi:ABC-type Fe3+ transport system permease subunit